MNEPSSPGSSRAPGLLLVAVFLLAASGLMFELTLTRIFSATIWYHYTFVAISVALFGWGLGGFLVYVFRLSRFKESIGSILVGLTVLLAVSLPLFPYAILQFPFTPDRLNTYFLLSLAPFLIGGATLSLLFEHHGSDSNRLYFADLVGAAAGTLMVPIVISRLGAETAVLATAILPAIASVLLAAALLPGKRGASLLTGLAVCFTVGLTVWNHRTQMLTIRDAPEKAQYKLLHDHPKSKIATDRWNAYSRITSVTGFDEHHVARLFIDSDAETSILKWDGDPKSIPAPDTWFRILPLRMKQNPRVLVIGPGGGADVVLSIAYGSPSVTAVEMNPLIIDAVNHFGEAAGKLYSHDRLTLVMDEGRNYVERTAEKFDFIVLGFVDSWASVASGGLSLTENYLYTRDALEAYYDLLTPEGALVIVRWPTDIPRLVANSVDLLTRRGVPMAEIGRRVLAVARHKQEGETPVETVFMLTKWGMSNETVDRLLSDHEKAAKPAHVFYAPGRESEAPYRRLFNGDITFEHYTKSFEQLATPVTDDHPFYFATEKPFGLPGFVIRLFLLPLGAVLGFTAILLLGTRVMGFSAPSPRTVAYFGGLGIGFIVCEIALMQRLILLLGHPIYTIVVILFTILLAAGLGSAFAKRFTADRIHAALGRIIPLVIMLVIVGAIVLPRIVQAALPLELPARIALAAAIVFPYGFLMGMPFPLGLRSCAQQPGGPPVSALWGINGVASVIGSISAVALAVVGGFTTVFAAGAACYALAWATRPRSA